MGLSDEDAFASIRFSLGKFNISDEVINLVQIIYKTLIPTLI
jgi:cysteine sulfinate desulfinase/cysteine desulfurase-like protein